MQRSFLIACIATAFVGACAQAQTLTLISPTVNDGSFESAPTAKTFFPTTTSATGTIPYWAATGVGATNDTGTQTGGNIEEDGTIGAFEQPATTTVTGGSIFNLVTSRPISVGDVYTLTFYGKDTQTSASSTLLASFFYQTAPAAGATYGYAALGALGTPTTFTLPGNGAAFMQFTMSYTVMTSDGAAGDDIGIALTNNGASYNGLDNFVLTVTPAAVPEPSTCVVLAVGSLGGMMAFRRRRA